VGPAVNRAEPARGGNVRWVPSPETLYLFAIACAGLVLLPGPALIFIVTRGVVHGRRGGLISTLGVETGNVVQVLAATVGLAAIVASSAEAFSVVKYVGAAYLIFLGVRALAGSRDGAGPSLAQAKSQRRLFVDGVLVGALNPKLALFLLAFLPQFVDPAAGPVWLQTLVLGLIFNVIATVGDSLFAVAAASAGGRLRGWLRSRRLAQASGVVYLGLGAVAALSQGEAKS
jgi:threonine/homoserine/homoserine lactone efflux protein